MHVPVCACVVYIYSPLHIDAINISIIITALVTYLYHLLLGRKSYAILSPC